MKIIKDISYADFDECKLDLHLPDATQFPVMVFFHGGGIEGGDKDTQTIFDSLIENGIVVVLAKNSKQSKAFAESSVRAFVMPRGGGVMPKKPKRSCQYPAVPKLTDSLYYPN